jgi:tetratricopeptide (TPR) repeat protein
MFLVYHRNLLIYLLLILMSNHLVAQNDVPLSRENIDFLIQAGTKANDSDLPVKALEFFSKAQIIAERQQRKDKLCIIMMNTGLSYAALSNYGEALKCYEWALTLARTEKNEEYELFVLNNIGIAYQDKGDFRSALANFLVAYERPIAKKSFAIVPLAINIADMYNNIGQPGKAIEYLEAIRKKNIYKSYEQLWTANYAEALFLQGKVQRAKNMMDILYTNINKDVVDYYAGTLEIITKIYAAQGKYAEALNFANQGLRSTNKLSDRINLYCEVSAIFEKRNDFKKVAQYKDSILMAKDSLASINSKGMYEANKVKLKIQDYQNQLKVHTERQSTERNMFIIGIVCFLLSFIIIYRGLRNRILKQRQAQIIADNEKMIYSLELENLKNNIAEKNRKLSAKALYLSGRNELIEEIVNSLSQDTEVTKSKEVNEYIKTLKTYIKTDSEWDDFISYFEQVNPTFIKTLNEKFPELNTSDIRFICYIYMNLDLREIGNIFNITYNAAVKRHRRIKEKMKIDTEMPISEYLIQELKNQ